MGTDVKSRLYRSAISLIASKGLGPLTVRTIAQRAMTSADRLYAHYKSVNNLYVSIYEDGWNLIMRCVGARLMSAGGTINEQLTAIFQGVFAAMDQDHELAEAALVLNFTTVGWPIASRLRQSESSRLFEQGLCRVLSSDRGESSQNEDTQIVNELFIGGIYQLLFRMTALGGETEVWRSPQIREAIISHVILVNRSLTTVPGTTTHPD